MTEWVGSKARRMLVAGAVAFVVGVPMLACSGSESGGSDDGAEEHDDGGGDDKKADGIEAGMIGTFKVKPSESALREFQIINAAINGKPPPKKVQPLKPPEKELYQAAKKASGAEKEYMKSQIKLMKGARITFKDGGKGMYEFDGGTNPFDWSLSGASGNEGTITLNYDHGVKEKAELELKGGDLHAHFTEPRSLDLVFAK
jgi:hypothetical protein